MKKLIFLLLSLLLLISIFLILNKTIIIYLFYNEKNALEEVSMPPIEENILLENEMEVHFVNMGRNDAILIRTVDKVIAIDGGTYRESIDFVNYIKNLEITDIDLLIGSHNHYNHIQAHARILQNFNVNQIYYPHQLEECKAQIICDLNDIRYVLDEINNQNKVIDVMHPGDVINIGNIEIRNYGPIQLDNFQRLRYPQNFNSLNFILTFGNVRFFFTGDGIQEENILTNFPNEDLRVDVFKLPHHGENQVSAAFLERTAPHYAVTTSNINNLSGRNRLTGNILASLGAEILYFEENKHIIFSTDGVNITYDIK